MTKKLMLFFALCSSAWATTTVSGNIKNLGTGAVTTGSFVRFYLRGCGGNQPRINGTALIAPTVGNVYYFDFVPNGSGAISGTLYSSRDSTGLLGGDIECGGSTTAVWYGMVAFLNGKAGPETAIHAKNTATIDISNVTAITTNPVITAPTGDSTYARLDAGNQPFTGTVQAPLGIINPTANNVDVLSSTRFTDSSPTGNWLNFKSAALSTLFKVDILGNLTGVAGTFSGTITATGTPDLTATNAGVFTNTQMNQYLTDSVNSLNFLTEFQAAQGNTNFATEGGSTGVLVPNTSTVFQANGFAAYTSNASTSTNTVAAYGQARGRAASVKIWGANFAAMDGGFALSSMIGNETDCNVTNTSTAGACFSASGAFTGNPASFPAYLVGAPVGGGTWSVGLATKDAATTTGISLGAQGTGANNASQNLNLLNRDAGNVQRAMGLQLTAVGNFLINNSNGGVEVPEIAAPSGIASNELIWGDSTAHRLKMNNNNGGAVTVGTIPLFNAAGTEQFGSPHAVQDTCTLGTNCGVTFSGSAAFTSASSYSCSCTDQTAAAACRGNQTAGNGVTFTGTGTDVLRFVCVGN